MAKKLQRNTVIDRLVNKTVEQLQNDNQFLSDTVLIGFKGFITYDNDALEAEYLELFHEEIKIKGEY